MHNRCLCTSHILKVRLLKENRGNQGHFLTIIRGALLLGSAESPTSVFTEPSCSRPPDRSQIFTNFHQHGTPSSPRIMEFPNVSLTLEPGVLQLIMLAHLIEENTATLQVWDLIILRPQASDAL